MRQVGIFHIICITQQLNTTQSLHKHLDTLLQTWSNGMQAAYSSIWLSFGNDTGWPNRSNSTSKQGESLFGFEPVMRKIKGLLTNCSSPSSFKLNHLITFFSTDCALCSIPCKKNMFLSNYKFWQILPFMDSIDMRVFHPTF